jgi:hypothetical protein
LSTYISYFTAPRYAAANRTLISRFTRAVAQSQTGSTMRATEKEATRILTRHLKIDDTLAAQT